MQHWIEEELRCMFVTASESVELTLSKMFLIVRGWLSSPSFRQSALRKDSQITYLWHATNSVINCFLIATFILSIKIYIDSVFNRVSDLFF